jgi:hypothetical protein
MIPNMPNKTVYSTIAAPFSARRNVGTGLMVFFITILPLVWDLWPLAEVGPKPLRGKTYHPTSENIRIFFLSFKNSTLF